jgi:two-component system, sensor histidine kinase
VSSAIRVLVADDDPDSVTGLIDLLNDEGFDAIGAHDGEEALSTLARFDPDAVVLDIAMPRLNGWEVARRIRKLKGPTRPLLIGITGVYMEDPDLILGKMSGFDHYLPKPYELKSLLALLAPVRK